LCRFATCLECRGAFGGLRVVALEMAPSGIFFTSISNSDMAFINMS
jgi:hypothetical protein